MTGGALAGWLRTLQDDICGQLETLDGTGKFAEDAWTRSAGGGGRSRVLSRGSVFEKAGVMFSEVHGTAPPFLLREHAHGAGAAGITDPRFFATGVSIVIHPVNPHVPIIHMNIRCFEMLSGEKTVQRWLGGGIDLTPHYVDPAEARHFHTALKNVCDRHDATYYPRFSEWADNYFFLPHRNETRGIGGIFFDKLGAENDARFGACVPFWKAVGELFAPLYSQIVIAKKDRPATERHKQWQLLRRGRYVEFNLLYDKGTKFGLESGGRIESILVSLPATAGWEYNFTPEKESAEAETLGWLRKGVKWV